MKEVVGSPLFPVFLQLNELHVLLVAGGKVGLEKLTALLENSPNTTVTLVARKVSTDIRDYVEDYPRVQLQERTFDDTDLDGVDLVVVASNNPELNEHIRQECRKRHLLINVADKPDLC